MPNLVTVRVRDCACPGGPHSDGDTVDIRPTLSLEGGLDAEQLLADAIAAHPLPEKASSAESDRIAEARTRYLRPRWLRSFILHGAVGWNLTDDAGRPVPFDPEVILADYDLAKSVADACDERYSAVVLRPFLTRPDAPSPPGPTVASTSAATESMDSPS